MSNEENPHLVSDDIAGVDVITDANLITAAAVLSSTEIEVASTATKKPSQLSLATVMKIKKKASVTRSKIRFSVMKLIAMTTSVNSVAGLVMGYSYAFPAIYLQFDQMSTDCASFLTAVTCLQSNDQNFKRSTTCLWNANVSTCLFSDLIDCSLGGASASTCKSISSMCFFSDTDSSCTHLHGWTETQQGLFGCSILIGAAVSNIFVGKILSMLGHKRTLVIIGLVGMLFSGLMHITSAFGDFGSFVTMNVLVGLPISISPVVSSTYVAGMAPRQHVFQAFCAIELAITIGILIGGIMGFAMNPMKHAYEATGVNYTQIMQLSIMPLTFFCSLLTVAGLIIPEYKPYLDKKPELAAQNDFDVQELHVPEYPILKSKWMYYVLATFLVVANQFTGVMAFLVYAPQYMAPSGLEPLTSNLVVTAWSVVTAALGLFMTTRMTVFALFKVGALLASLAALLAGILLYPGNLSNSAAIAIVQITTLAIFFVGFEFMACTFFALIVVIFPPELRESGPGFSVAVQSVATILVVFLYPVATRGLAVSGHSQQGVAIVDIIFGGLGILSLPIVFMWLKLEIPETAHAADERCPEPLSVMSTHAVTSVEELHGEA